MLAVLFCGLSLWLQAAAGAVTTARRYVAQGSAIDACLLAALILSEHLLALDLGIDLWRIALPEISGDTHPGRTAPATAVTILMLGLALLWLDTKPFATYFFDQAAALLGVSLATLYRKLAGEGDA